MSALASYAAFVDIVRVGLLYAGIAAAAVCAIDWAARTRRISPFGRTARFFRARVDPAIAPVERMVVRAGGVPSAAPWWALLGVALIGILLIGLLQVIGGIITQAMFGLSDPRELPKVIGSWIFSILRIAIIVRVIASWLPGVAYSKWLRWAFPLTEWMLAPLRKFIPMIARVDITPLVAWILLDILQSVLGIP